LTQKKGDRSEPFDGLIPVLLPKVGWKQLEFGLIRYIIEEKWSLHSFLTTAPQQADVAGNILLFFYKKKTKQNKKIIKYYQPRQLVVELLWEMSVGN